MFWMVDASLGCFEIIVLLGAWWPKVTDSWALLFLSAPVSRSVLLDSVSLLLADPFSLFLGGYKAGRCFSGCFLGVGCWSTCSPITSGVCEVVDLLLWCFPSA